MPTVETFTHVINQLLPEPHASLLSGMLFGVRRTMPPDFYQDLITTGTLHVIALSGQNIAILITLVAGLTLPLFGRKISSVLTIIWIVLFILFVGASPSVVRAGLMGALSLFAIYFGRRNWSLLSLMVATGVMILARPNWISEISFQLSFAATLGIILFGPKNIQPISGSSPNKSDPLLEPQKSGYSDIYRNFLMFLRNDLRLTLAAQSLTIPIILYHFGRFSLISPIANLLVGWAVPLIMMMGIPTVILAWVFMPLGRLLALIIWVPLSYFITFVKIMASLPFASIEL